MKNFMIFMAVGAGLLSFEQPAKADASKGGYYYCFAAGYDTVYPYLTFTPILKAPVDLSEETSTVIRNAYREHLKEVDKYTMGEGVYCSKTFTTKADAESGAAEEEAADRHRYLPRIAVMKEVGRDVSPRRYSGLSFSGPTSAEWKQMLAGKGVVAAPPPPSKVTSTPVANSSGSIVVADDYAAARRASAAAERAKLAAAEKRKGKLIEDATRAKSAKELAETRRKQAARKAAFLARCPSGACQ